jgi:hypothetical protein
MKTIICAALALIASSVYAQVNCVGSDAFKTCTDMRTGNTYQVNRMGNMTNVYGSNPNGSQWSQQSQQIGNMNITNGIDARGRAWNETQQTFGNGTVIRSGTDGAGRPFYQTCNQFGCF